VEERVTGLLVPPGDTTALRGAIERLLGDDELRRRLGAAAREKAREELSWEASTKATIEAYRTALAQ
jgi:glycosyltransferase involved in cell wall biosynthesis